MQAATFNWDDWNMVIYHNLLHISIYEFSKLGHTHTHTQIHIRTPTQIHIRIPTQIHSHTHTYVYSYILSFLFIYLILFISILFCPSLSLSLSLSIYIYIYIYIYIRLCVYVCVSYCLYLCIYLHISISRCSYLWCCGTIITFSFMCAAYRLLIIDDEDNYEWVSLYGKIVFCNWKLALSNGVIVLPVSVEINARLYSRSVPRVIVEFLTRVFKHGISSW